MKRFGIDVISTVSICAAILCLIAVETFLVPPPRYIPASIKDTPTIDQGRVRLNNMADMTYRIRAKSCVVQNALELGTAFAIDPHWLLTAKHVVVGSPNVEAETWDGQSITIDGVYVPTDENLDIAWLHVTDKLPQWFTLSDHKAPLNTSVTVIGYPHGNPTTITEGSVIEWDAGVDEWELPTTAKVTNGNSGGPMINDTGQVVGVVSKSASVQAQQVRSIGVSADTALTHFDSRISSTSC